MSVKTVVFFAFLLPVESVLKVKSLSRFHNETVRSFGRVKVHSAFATACRKGLHVYITTTSSERQLAHTSSQQGTVGRDKKSTF